MEFPTEVELTVHDGVHEGCAVSLDNIITIPKQYLALFIADLSAERMNEVWEALHRAYELPF